MDRPFAFLTVSRVVSAVVYRHRTNRSQPHLVRRLSTACLPVPAVVVPIATAYPTDPALGSPK